MRASLTRRTHLLTVRGARSADTLNTRGRTMGRDRIMQLAQRLAEDARRLELSARSMADFIVEDDFVELDETFRKLEEAMKNEM